MQPAAFRRFVLAVLVALVPVVAARIAGAAPMDEPLDPAELRRVDAALPERPQAEPDRARRVVVFTKTAGFRHASIPIGAEAIIRMGRATGAYRAVRSEDVNDLRPSRLAGVDAIVFLSTTGSLFDDPRMKEGLLEFVRRGGGVVGIHAATDCFYDWPEWGRMMGAWFENHPWHERVTIRIEEPEHPVCAAFDGETFEVTDEIYQFREEPYSRAVLRVLASLDHDGTDMSKPGIVRTDGDFAVSWIRSYGEGRVFYTSLGHRSEIFWNPTVLAHYLDGIQYALGDLEADDAPSLAGPRVARAGQSAGDDPADPVDAAVETARTYRFGDSRRWQSVLGERVLAAMSRPAGDPERRRLEDAMIEILRADRAGAMARDFACRPLALIGGRASVPTLRRLLGDRRLFEPAMAALRRIDDPMATSALIEAVERLDSAPRRAAIRALGDRGEHAVLERLLMDSMRADEATVVATIRAIGDAGHPEGLALLELLREAGDGLASDAVQAAILDGTVALGHRRLARRDVDDATGAATMLRRSGSPAHARAGLALLAAVDPVGAAPAIVARLDDEDEAWRTVARRLVVHAGDRSATEAFAAELDRGPSERRIALAGALAERGDRAAAPAVSRMLLSARQPVGFAGIDALGELGGPKQVETLLAIGAAIDGGEGSEIATESLARLRAPGVDAAIMGEALGDRPEVRRLAAELLGRRRATGQAEALVDVALAETDPGARIAQLEAIASIADGPDVLRSCVPLVERARTDEEIAAAEAALIAIAGRIEDRAVAAAPIIDAYVIADASDKPSFLRIMGTIGGAIPLEICNGALAEIDPAIAEAALQALERWPDAGAALPLFDVLRYESDPDKRRRGIEAYARAVLLAESLDPEREARFFEGALVLARSAEERSILLRRMGGGSSLATLEVLEGWVDGQGDPAVGDAAVDGVLALAERIATESPGRAEAALLRTMRRRSDRPELRSAVASVIDRIQRDEGFIRAWQVAGPYEAAGVGAPALFDRSFGPESGDADVDWAMVDEADIDGPGMVDLDRLIGGGDRCAYLRTTLVSPERRTVRLEFGSDDGLKVWLNGDVILESNEMRGLTRADDVVEVELAEGPNVLLLKITQGGGGWEACCRVRDPEGFAAEGVRAEAGAPDA